MSDDRLIKPREAAEMLEISYASLYAGIAGTSGLTRYKVGSQTRYSLNEVQQLKDKNWKRRQSQFSPERPCPTELV